eukprot:6214557-Pleurochrysis_carterae.AAC.7
MVMTRPGLAFAAGFGLGYVATHSRTRLARDKTSAFIATWIDAAQNATLSVLQCKPGVVLHEYVATVSIAVSMAHARMAAWCVRMSARLKYVDSVRQLFGTQRAIGVTENDVAPLPMSLPEEVGLSTPRLGQISRYAMPL